MEIHFSVGTSRPANWITFQPMSWCMICSLPSFIVDVPQLLCSPLHVCVSWLSAYRAFNEMLRKRERYDHILLDTQLQWQGFAWDALLPLLVFVDLGGKRKERR